MYTEEQYRDHIRELQEYLRALAALDERYPLVAVDGIYGPETAKAVAVFQEIGGNPVTSTVNRADWERLVREYRSFLSITAPASPIAPFPSPTFVLKPGDRDPLTCILREMLDTIDGTSSGCVYDEALVARVRAFRLLHDLPASDTVDRTVWDLLSIAYEQTKYAT